MHILITGGAGFVGSHVADQLLARGHDVRVLDSLDPLVHPSRQRPEYLDRRVAIDTGDIRDPEAVRRALDGIDGVLHFAARVGVGQSVYEIASYTSTNTLGTAVLLEQLVARSLSRLVVASSMSLYGEGRYRTRDGVVVDDVERSAEALRQGLWDPTDADGEPLVPLPTPETKTPRLTSVYALSKFDQERLAFVTGAAYGIPTVALRFFNVYGTRQALSNSNTGVLAMFAARLLHDRPPLLFEDGQQRRDFVSVSDVAAACVLALEGPDTHVAGQALNVGSGRSWTVADVARLLASTMGRDIEPELTGRCRVGDVRHCFADITEAGARLGYHPVVALEDGLVELADWLADQAPEDLAPVAARDLEQRGLPV
jgi:dTDP-L-rhamnose 4-epimerase